MTRDETITAWLASKELLAKAKKVEKQLKDQLLAFYFEGVSGEGTRIFELGNGYKLKAVLKTNYKLDDNETVIDALNDIPFDIAKAVVKWKTELVKNEYENLNEINRKIVDSVLTSKPAAITLEFIDPTKGKS